jgi:hypothetical protein
VIEPKAAAASQSRSPAPAFAGAGRFIWRGLTCSIALAAVSLTASAWVVQAHGNGLTYRDGPPPGFSSGFGEDHCQACHFGDKVNPSPGSLSISAPQRYHPGQTYAVTVTLARPGMKIGGFQLTARFEEGGAQAGTLTLAAGDQDRLKVLTDRGVQYAYHLLPGTQLTAPDVVRWTLRWTAPAGSGSVLFNAAANAANADESQFGDFVYTAWVRARGL